MPTPRVADFWKAIDLYLSLAYPGPPPAAVRAKLEGLRQAPQDQLFDNPAFERPAQSPQRLALRLGNRFYPHMKLAIEPCPDGQGVLFRADTHDKHCCPPPTSREYPAFCQLMDQNQKLAQQIEAAWEREHLTTFKSYLREDLKRRQQQNQ